MAVSTATTTLSYKTGSESSFTKLVDIIDYPDMGSAPSKLDTTTLSASKMKTNIFGLQEAPELTFNAFYDDTVYDTILALEGESVQFELSFGESGADGAFSWTGQISVIVTGAGVDEVRQMSLTISCESEITKS